TLMQTALEKRSQASGLCRQSATHIPLGGPPPNSASPSSRRQKAPSGHSSLDAQGAPSSGESPPPGSGGRHSHADQGEEASPVQRWVPTQSFTPWQERSRSGSQTSSAGAAPEQEQSER